MIDFHSHMLPKMDDGSKSSDESLQMLIASSEQGVEAVVLTPHYYGMREYPAEFLERRTACCGRLVERMNEYGDTLPRLYLGAEVLMFPGLSGIEELGQLTVNGSRYILIEMPFEPWQDWMFKELDNMISAGMVPIIAHLERYMRFQKGTDNLERLFGRKVLIQTNAEAYLDGFSSRKMFKMVSEGRVSLLGSDSHNMTSRPPNMGPAVKVIAKKCGPDSIRRINKVASDILR